VISIVMEKYGGFYDENGRYNCTECGRKWHLGRAYSSLYYIRKHYENNHPIPLKIKRDNT
jgi:transposase-like protein